MLNCNECKNTDNCKCELIYTKHGTVFDHTMEVLKNLPDNSSFELQMAALLHDVGKNELTSEYIDGKCRFINHEKLGKRLVKKRLINLHFSKESMDKIVFLVEHHMDICKQENISDKTYRKLIREAGEYTDDLLYLIDADGAGTHYFDNETKTIHGIPAKTYARTRINELIKKDIEHNKKKFVYFTGDEIMQIFNLTPCAEVGKIKNIQIDIIDEFGTDLDKYKVLGIIKERYFNKQ